MKRILAALLLVALVIAGCDADTEPASNVTQTSATLHATLDGKKGEDVTYRFQYRAVGASSWTDGPLHNPGALGADVTGYDATENITGLTPGTTYEYRLIGWFDNQPNNVVVFDSDRVRPPDDNYDRFTTQAAPVDAPPKLIIWSSTDNITSMSAADHDGLEADGVDGYAMSLQRVPGLGSNATTWANKLQAISDFALAHPQDFIAAGIDLNEYNGKAPADWYSDSKWQLIYNAVDTIVAKPGVDGITLDGEDYSSTLNWNNGVPTSPPADPNKEAQAKLRGQQFASHVPNGFPIMEYFNHLHGGWDENVQCQVNNSFCSVGTYANYVQEGWYDGLTDTGDTVHAFESIFYKGSHTSTPCINGSGCDTPEESWDNAEDYDNANWDSTVFGARPNTYNTPFVWILQGPKCAGVNGNPPDPTAFDCARTPEQVAVQLNQSSQHSQGGILPIYHHGAGGCVCPQSYAPYAASMRAASGE